MLLEILLVQANKNSDKASNIVFVSLKDCMTLISFVNLLSRYYQGFCWKKPPQSKLFLFLLYPQGKLEYRTKV